MDTLLYRANLLAATHSFIYDLSHSAPLPTLLSHFPLSASLPEPTITEHGTQHQLLPFLGTYTGLERIERYFLLLDERLGIGKLRFEEKEGAVDEEKGVVWCKGEGEFTVLKTGKGWKESIAYRMRWAQQEGRLVLVEWEIWAGESSSRFWMERGGS